MSANQKEYDAIIIGAGAAGLSSGIYFSRAKRKVRILEQGMVGGQIVLSHRIANYPGVEDVLGYQLSATMKKQALDFGCELSSGAKIVSFDLKSVQKEIVIEYKKEQESLSAPVVILASGGQPRPLGIASEETFKGRGISYCATCDGDFFTGHDIVVVGGGNSALEEAVALTQYVNSVTIVHQFDHFQGYAHAIQEAQKNPKISFMMESEIVEFFGENSLQGVKVKSNQNGEVQELKVTGAFIFIGYVPNSQPFQGVVAMNEFGEIITDESMATNIPGVYAAGDVRQKRFRQITTAVSDGTIAALSAMDYLEKQNS